jgi:hypothetical protein
MRQTFNHGLFLDCDSEKYYNYLVFAVGMVLIYPVGSKSLNMYFSIYNFRFVLEYLLHELFASSMHVRDFAMERPHNLKRR